MKRFSKANKIQKAKTEASADISQWIEDCGVKITEHQLRVMHAIHKLGGECCAYQITQFTGILGPSLSRVLKKTTDYISTKESNADKRVLSIQLTASGKRVLNKFLKSSQ